MGPQGGVYTAGQLGISENTPICGQAYWFYVQVGPMVADIGCGVGFLIQYWGTQPIKKMQDIPQICWCIIALATL